MNSYFEVVIKSVVVYIILVILTRFMGRKQIAQLTYFDYVVGITIGSVAAEIIIARNVRFDDGIIVLITWCLMTMVISLATMKNITLRLLIDSEPLIIIDKGKVIYKNMKKAKYNIGDLLMQLRDKDVFNITDVEMAILEPDGRLSILRKAANSLVTVSDLKLKEPEIGMMTDLVLNGKILSSHLSLIQKDEKWLLDQLKVQNISELRIIAYAGIQADGQIYIVTK